MESTGTLVHEDGPRPPRDHALLDVPAARVLSALDPAGVIRFIDVDSGAEPTALLIGRPAGPIDVSAWHDGGLDHLAVLEQNEEEQHGTLALFPFLDPFFGPGTSGGFHEGSTRTLAVREGAVVFQEDLGQRWHLSRWAGGFLPSIVCGLPRSILGLETNGDETVIRALSYAPGEGASLLHVTLDAGGFSDCDRAPLIVKGGAGPSVRAVELAGGERALVDSHGGRVAVGRLLPSAASILRETSAPAARIEHAAAWRRGVRSGIVVLGSEPPLLFAIELDGRATQLEVIGEARAPLSGSVGSARSFYSRDLVEVSGLFFVATASGLEAFELVLDDGVIALDAVALDPFYRDLRGPLLALPALAPAD